MTAINRRAMLGLSLAAAFAAPAVADPLPLISLPGDVPAPDTTLPDLSGKAHSLSDYRGRPVLVSFWAVWCPPCRRELAALADLHRRLANTPVALFAVNLGDSRERITDFLADHPAPNLPILMDADRATAAAWHVRGLPVAYAVGKDGRLRLGALGERDWRAPLIEKQLRALV